MTLFLDSIAVAGDPRVTGSALARCVPDVAEFAATSWGRTPLLTTAEALPGGFDDLFSASDVDALMGPQALRVPFFRMVRNGTSIPTSRYTRSAVAGDRTLTDLPDSAKVAQQFADGASIVLQALHRVRPELGRFCADLAAELGHPTQVNAYVTPPGAQGFADHHDTHDVFVMQVDGEKHWHIREPVTELPVPAQPSSDIARERLSASPTVLDVTLRAGDVLYLPRGYIHSATTSAERSIHLTVGLLQTTWFDVLRDTVAGAYENPWLREALPLGGEAVDVERLRREAIAWLESVPSERLADAVTSRRRRAVPPEPVAPLAQLRFASSLTATTALRPRRGMAHRVEPDGERVVLALPDKRISLPGVATSALHALLAGETTAAAVADTRLDEADVLVVARRLVREHVLLPAS